MKFPIFIIISFYSLFLVAQDNQAIFYRQLLPNREFQIIVVKNSHTVQSDSIKEIPNTILEKRLTPESSKQQSVVGKVNHQEKPTKESNNSNDAKTTIHLSKNKLTSPEIIKIKK